MADKLVVGVQVDNLEGMDKFGGREASVAYPHWKQDLKNRVKFELGEVGVEIIDGTFDLNAVRRGKPVEPVQDLVDALIVKNRSSVVFRSAWIETKPVGGNETDVITQEGEMNMLARQ